MDDECLICGKGVPDYEPEGCCSGFECGCLGMPMNPCVCSDECHEAVFDYEGTMDERRIKAGIPIFHEEVEATGFLAAALVAMNWVVSLFTRRGMKQ